ncbi:MAG: helix-turn-helix domain-containing protein [Spirochaetes bacterium]|nr:helix-turn-helix domain-containing protein [Spirochaetota bacterium]
MEPKKPPCVGKNIQKIRKQQQITLSVLAERSGVSKAMLSQIESQKVNPTIATIWKIARGLEVELDTLLKVDTGKVRKFIITGRENTTTLDTTEKGPHIRVLSPISMAEDLEIYLITFEPDTVLTSNAHEAGTEEYLTILKGSIKVSAGGKTAELKKEDFIIYSCDTEHTIANTSESEAQIHMIVRFRKKQWEQA